MKKLKPEGCAWVEEQAQAGNWVRTTGFPFSNRGGRTGAIAGAQKHAEWLRVHGTRQNVRVAEYFFNVLEQEVTKMQPTKKLYRAEWMHNGQWRMDEAGHSTFKTRRAAERHNAQVQGMCPTLEVRIVEVSR